MLSNKPYIYSPLHIISVGSTSTHDLLRHSFTWIMLGLVEEKQTLRSCVNSYFNIIISNTYQLRDQCWSFLLCEIKYLGFPTFKMEFMNLEFFRVYRSWILWTLQNRKCQKLIHPLSPLWSVVTLTCASSASHESLTFHCNSIKILNWWKRFCNYYKVKTSSS